MYLKDIPKSNRFSQYTNERLSKFRENFWNSTIRIQIKVKKAELPTWIYAMFSLCILLIVFTFKRRQNTKKHMVCHHEFQENEVAYRCLEGFSDITWQPHVFNFPKPIRIGYLTTNQNLIKTAKKFQQHNFVKHAFKHLNMWIVTTR